MSTTPHSAGLTVTAQASELRRAAAWLHAEAGARAVPDSDIARLDMCLHEALANIIDHGDLAAAAPVQLRLQVQPGSATLTLEDGGVAYDPTQAVAPPRPLMLEDTLPGGLGVVMLRSHSDQLDYAWRDGRNQLTVTVRWSAA
ncbi:ATP-binding protein [Duganella sp. sic0402]|uniref:ATP-binding protein n=1 Tax=Duganella sp. sic0402 TaxID=2854786 RepID=UPI001C4828DF|nr:ATP-binding protein [Duganella sp. sic0402]MBV7538307.1 ATP-binding protein [Duganella sp. sic0402]